MSFSLVWRGKSIFSGQGSDLKLSRMISFIKDKITLAVGLRIVLVDFDNGSHEGVSVPRGMGHQ